MTTCAGEAGAPALRSRLRPASADETLFASRPVADGILQTELSVPSAHCGGCIARIENALRQLDGVVSARLNLSTRRATVKWRKADDVPPFIEALEAVGFAASLFASDEPDVGQEKQRLLRATAVAGFCTMNIMLLSVSVWAGAAAPTRHLFHLLSAVLAVPAVFYSGRIFLQSAWHAISKGRTNMDVPISIGILLALTLSIHDTLSNGPHAYFDAVTALIFFLLIGRTLDHIMRGKARTAVMGLGRTMPRGATVAAGDGRRVYKQIEQIGVGEVVVVAAGDRVPLDGRVVAGAADLDASAVTGEAVPVPAFAGDAVLAGMMNLNGMLEVRVERTSRSSFVADMVRMIESAEHARARYRRLTDRAAALYAPVVHGLAAAAFIVWFVMTGDGHRSLTVAISVLIVTCPCALGLAVPMVHVMAARRLLERGIALKDGSALERLAEVDAVVFDKTGTLTLGTLTVASRSVRGRDLDVAMALAHSSGHPTAHAIGAMPGAGALPRIDDFAEVPGQGLEARINGVRYRLGRPEWALEESGEEAAGTLGATTLARDGRLIGCFTFSDTVRPEARDVVRSLGARGMAVEMLSGDRRKTVAALARDVGIAHFRPELLPRQKVERLEELSRQGRKTLMIGDGLNDGPALSAAYVSMAPSSAADVGRAAADLVFFGGRLSAVTEALQIAATARRLVRQNLALAIGYNLLVIPVALTGHVTPLMAAVAMSLSSILVVANALRLSHKSNRSSASDNGTRATTRTLAVAP
jgi:Cu2+-exporting ATPase